MKKILDLGSEVRFELENDTEPKTVWILGVLDTRIVKKLEDINWEYEALPGQPETARAKATFNTAKNELELVAFGLKGFENLQKPDGKPLYFKSESRVVGGKTYQVVAEEILRVIPGDAITELAKKIREINSIGIGQAGN